MRLEEKEWHNLKHNICEAKLAIRNIILLHNTRHKKDISQKLSFKQLKSYKIFDLVKDKDTYIRKELDELHLVDTFASNKLKKFTFDNNFTQTIP